ncbi:hypothetical protein BGZ94_007360 [Podila epigama]|nr:hypothetical protein BGZ94_007360 [Podila epigama]
MTDRDLLSLESQNDEELSGLHSKVAMLKKITMDIGNEVRESTQFLNELDQDFGRTGGLLNTTYTRLKVMASTQNGRYMCYMVSFCVAGCVPIDKAGRRVMLVSSSKNEGEWVLPKGGWENDESQEEAAARETWEEAGVLGQIVAHLGEFEHKINKRTGVPESIFFFYEMEVQQVEAKWPERKKRERRWFSYEDALQIVSKKVMRMALEQCSLARA